MATKQDIALEALIVHGGNVSAAKQAVAVTNGIRISSRTWAKAIAAYRKLESAEVD